MQLCGMEQMGRSSRRCGFHVIGLCLLPGAGISGCLQRVQFIGRVYGTHIPAVSLRGCGQDEATVTFGYVTTALYFCSLGGEWSMHIG